MFAPMLRSYKYRLKPTPEQATLLNKHFGSVRFLWNLALETKQKAWIGNRVNLNRYDLQVQLKELKKECPWLKEVNSQSLQTVLKNLDAAYLSFFKRQSNFPRFKNKSSKNTFTVPQYVKIEDDKLIIPKFREGIKIVLHRPTKGTIRRVTISRTPTGKYFASVLCETGEECKPKPKVTEETTVGVDLGIKDFAITSEGEVFPNPKYLKEAQSKLKFLQRKYSKSKGKRTKQKLAKQHEKIANKRKDFLHKVSTRLIRENQSIALESLNVSGMLKNHSLAQAISDVGWSTFVTMLEYKAEWYDVNILKIGRFAPSSKTCSNCGTINKELQLKDREWICPDCGSVLSRDVNAACNIKTLALKNYVSGTDTKTQSELPSLEGVLTSEAHRSLVGG